MTNEELKSHIKAIAEWGKSKNRTVFVVCAEFTKDGMTMDAGVSGATMRIPYTLYKAAEDDKTIKSIVGAAGEAVKNPVGAMLLKIVAEEGPLGRFSDDDRADKPEDSGSYAKDCDSFMAKFKEWFCKK